MTTGLPGIGIGGVFYLLCALLMPIVELAERASGRSPRRGWRTVLLHFLIAWGVLGAIGATGLLVSELVSLTTEAGVVSTIAAQPLAQAGQTYGVPGAAGLATLGLLVLVLGLVQILRRVSAPTMLGREQGQSTISAPNEPRQPRPLTTEASAHVRASSVRRSA